MTTDAIIIIPDTHHPYTNWNVLREARDHYLVYKRQKKTVKVIQMGDLTDQKAWSRFPKDVDDDNPTLEWMKTEDALIRMGEWFPEMTLILGNHDVRIIKKCLEVGIPKKLIPKLEKLFPFQGWDWHMSHRPLVIDNVMYVHGDEFAGNAIAKAKRAGMSVVQGHDHQMYLEFLNTMGRKTFGMGTGCTVDVDSPAAAYAAKNPMGVDLGFAEIIKGVPHLIPYF